jgi:hypothetical protein
MAVESAKPHVEKGKSPVYFPWGNEIGNILAFIISPNPGKFF